MRLFLLAFMALICNFSFAQDHVDPMFFLHAAEIDKQQMPEDTALRKGILSNGLTYYVLRNDMDKNRAYLRLLVKAGSVHEKDNERGISHFVEHMEFKGTKHFPGRNVIGFMNRSGIPFGYDSNASTGFETVIYQLDRIPTDNPLLLDSCILLLRDWAGEATMSKEDVGSEHNVVVEEWRSKNLFSYANQAMSNLFNNSIYSQRFPIGDMDIVRNCSQELVRGYYQHWYQPQNEAVVIVGDFDPDKMVEKIKTMFGDMKRGETIVPPCPSIPDNDTPNISTYQDARQRECLVLVLTRLPALSAEEITSVGGRRTRWMRDKIKDMVRDRIKTLIKSDTCLLDGDCMPFTVGDVDKMKFMLFSMETTKKNWKHATQKLAMLIENIRRHGFKDEEWKPEYMQDNPAYNADSSAIVWADTAIYKHLDKMGAWERTKQLCECFFGDRRYVSDEVVQCATHYIHNSTTHEQLHDEFNKLTSGKNMYVTTFFPEDATMPTEEEVRAVLDGVKNMTDEELASVDAAKAERLEVLDVDSMDFAVVPGTVLKTVARNDSTTEFLLSNGIKVVLIKAKYNLIKESETNEIALRFGRPSGLSVLSKEDIPYGDMLSSCVRKYKNLTMTNHFEHNSTTDRYYDIICKYVTDSLTNVSTLMENCFKCMYATLTCNEVDSVAFAEKLDDITKGAITFSNNSVAQAQEKISSGFIESPDRQKHITVEEASKLNIQRFGEVLREYTSNYNGSVLCIQGEFETDSIMPYILKYVASLPSKSEPVKRVAWPEDHFKTTNTTRVETIPNASPLCITFIGYTWEKGFKYGKESDAHSKAFRNILNGLLLNKLRIEHSDVYTPMCVVDNSQFPFDQMFCLITYTCDPTQRERIAKDAEQIVYDMANGDLITQPLIDNFILEQKKAHANDTTNDYMRLKNRLSEELGEIVIDDSDLTYIQKLTPSSLKSFIKQMLKKGNVSVGYLTTE